MAAPQRIKPDTLKIFNQWLKDRGADVLAPLTRWEVLRFVANGETSVVYRNNKDLLSWTGESQKAWDCFKGQGKWMPGTAKKRKPKGQYIEALVQRDGPTCWYCRTLLDYVEMTTEHLVARSSGGPHHLDNLVIACQPCNERAHTKSVSEKVTLRYQQSSVTSDTIPRAKAASIARNYPFPAHGPSIREDIAKALEEHHG